MAVARLACICIMACVLTACNKPKWVQSTSAAATAAAAASAPAIPTTQDALPPFPAWSATLIGQHIDKALPAMADCIGNLDVVSEKYLGQAPGTKVAGWGWVVKSQKAIGRVVLVDANARIVGVGEGGQPRPDVPENSPTVKSPNTGWQAFTGLTSGAVDAFGVVDGQARCALGHLQL